MTLRISYWVIPIISGLIWLGTLLGLFLHWVIDTDMRHYPSMSVHATIPFISNIGAHELKPLFITGCVLTTITLDISFGADRWLRHKGRLVPNITRTEKVLKGITIFFAVVGTVGLILLSIFDTARYKRLHNTFLALFIGGYMLSAIFICWEYQRLRKNHREHRILRISFLLKLFFILLELGLCIAFGTCSRTKNRNAAAVLEWVISVVFSFYIFSFAVDLWPAMYTKAEAATAAAECRTSSSRSRSEDPAAARWDGSTEMEEAERTRSSRTSQRMSGNPFMDRIPNNF